MGTRKRLVATTLLVLIALGSAGLTVAADRVQDLGGRPQVTWAADHAAQPLIATLVAALSAMTPDVTALAKAGRDTLGNLQALDVEAVRVAIADGDAVAADVEGLSVAVNAAVAATSSIERGRLGP